MTEIYNRTLSALHLSTDAMALPFTPWAPGLEGSAWHLVFPLLLYPIFILPCQLPQHVANGPFCGRRKDKARPGIEPRVSLIPEGRANHCTTSPFVGGISNTFDIVFVLYVGIRLRSGPLT